MRTSRLIALVIADLVLVAAALFGIVVVTAADEPTRAQGGVAWGLFGLALVLVAALVVPLIVGLLRRMRRAPSRSGVS